MLIVKKACVTLTVEEVHVLVEGFRRLVAMTPDRKVTYSDPKIQPLYEIWDKLRDIEQEHNRDGDTF